MMELDYHRKPTPHVVIPKLMPSSIYEQMRFPDILPRPNGRIGRDIYFGEPEWPEVMAQPGWAQISSTFMSEEFMQYIIGVFADDIRLSQCGINPDKVYLQQRAETRLETESPLLSDTDDPNALFIRFDLQAIDASYGKTVHCDHLRRVIGGVLFMGDAKEEGMEGGEFALYSDLEFNNDRRCHAPKVEKIFPYQHNFGVLFLNSNTGFHGPLPIRELTGLRKWIYYSISSRRNIWKRSPIREV